MLSKVLTCALVGLDGALIEVEVDVSRSGLPNLVIVGLPDTSLSEARERVKPAIRNSRMSFPGDKRVVVNLAPAELRKEGSSYDLAIAVALLVATDQLPTEVQKLSALFIGELGLDGTLRHTDGILPMAAVARDHGIKQLFVPEIDAPEAALITGIEVYPVPSLSALCSHLLAKERLTACQSTVAQLLEHDDEPGGSQDFSFVKGQENAKRALEIAAAGGHNVLFSGPPGSGKTLLARSMVTILPHLEIEEALEVTKIYSVSGLLPSDKRMMNRRPFRAPHHTISNAGLVGGGRLPRPGEITLAHNGVLFLDELPEFGQPLLDNLRQPLEDRTLVISRAGGTLTFPANFILIAARNPCVCGYLGSSTRPCTCSPQTIARYNKRLSGPLLDRIDLHIDVPHVDYDKLSETRRGESSAQIRARVEAARAIQQARFKNRTITVLPSQHIEDTEPVEGQAPERLTAIKSKPTPVRTRRISTNAEMGPAEIEEFCKLDAGGNEMMKNAHHQLNLTNRSFHRLLKVARTIADLEGQPDIQKKHIAQALNYRRKDN